MKSLTIRCLPVKQSAGIEVNSSLSWGVHLEREETPMLANPQLVNPGTSRYLGSGPVTAKPAPTPE